MLKKKRKGKIIIFWENKIYKAEEIAKLKNKIKINWWWKTYITKFLSSYIEHCLIGKHEFVI